MRFRSPLLSQSRFLSFPPGTEMVHFPGFARTQLWIHRAVRGFYPRGFPHSEIPGSKPACGSPRLIAACHVLHPRLLPRHPPCALSSLTIKFTRHTAASPLAFSHQPSAIRKTTPRRANFMAPVCSSHAYPIARVTYTSRLIGTHKNLLSLVICPIYSVVKYRPRESSLVVCLWSLANNIRPYDSDTRLGRFELFPTQCSAPSDFRGTVN